MKKMLLTMVAALMAVLNISAQTTPPTGVEQKEFSFFGLFYEAGGSTAETVEESVKVAVSGSDIYLQMPNPFNGIGWIKGTIDGETATFPVQQIATWSTTPIYISGLSENGVGNIVFAYSEEMMTCNDQYIQFTNDQAGKNAYAYFTSVIINLPPEDDPVVTLPEGLQATTMEFTGNQMLFDEEGAYAGFQEVKHDVKVAFNGNTEVYVQGLCSYLPEGWVKGTITDGSFGDKTVTFAKGQCFGKYGFYQLYIGSRQGSAFTDMVFDYVAQTRTFSNEVGYYMVINASKTDPMPIDMFATAKIAPKTNGIAPTLSATEHAATYTDLQGRSVTNAAKGLLLKTLRLNDGTTKTIKVMRK